MPRSSEACVRFALMENIIVGFRLFQDDNNNRIERHNPRFFTISSLRRGLPATRSLRWPGRNRLQITCNASGAHHVQYVCHMVRRDSSAIKFDRVEIAFIVGFFVCLFVFVFVFVLFCFALFVCLFVFAETISRRRRRRNRSTRRKPLTTSIRKCHILKPENSSPNPDSNPHSSIGGRLGNQTLLYTACLTINTNSRACFLANFSIA